MTFTKEEIRQIRQETRGTRQVTHFNNAGAALMPDAVTDAVIGYLQHESNYGGYETEAQFKLQLEHTYDAIAELINAERDEIAILENATAAWHLAFHSMDFEDGDVILTCVSEYSSSFISYLKLQKKVQVEIKVIPNDEYGQLDIQALEDLIDTRVKIIAITHMPTNSGLINPVNAVGEIAQKYGIPYLLDACQSVGQIPIDVQAIGCDFLSATGRKYLRAPRGTGFLYVKKSWIERGIEPPFLDTHSATWTSPTTFKVQSNARRFENWESNCAAKYGLGLAVDYAMSIGMERISTRLRTLAEQLRSELSKIEGVLVMDIGKRKGGIVSFKMEGKTPAEIKAFLAEKKINVSTISPDGALLDSTRRKLGDGMVRASVHYYNTEEEVKQLCNALRDFRQDK